MMADIAFIPRCQERVKRKMKIEEEIANSVMNAAGLGVGSPSQREPGRPAELMPMQRRKKGRFMNQETFIVSSSTFNSIKHQKKKGMHWKRYLEEDDAYYGLREYANKKPNGPIIVEDDFTGACMYVRYGDLR
jgi:hypothetical protein